MSVLLNLGDKITAGNQADATLFYKKRVVADSGTLLTEPETDVNNRELLAQKLFDKASIVYTAGGVKAGTNYSVKGTDFDVVRAGVKNVVNRAGVLTEIASGVPATEFSDGVLKGTLIEPAGTNLLERSEEFDNEYWGSTEATITPNAVKAPNGEQTADNITFSEASGNVRKTLTGLTIVSGSTMTISLYTKTSVQITAFGGATSIAGTNVYSFEDVGNGYFRQKVTRTFSASGTGTVQFLINNANVGAGTVSVWGAQLETGSVATSYIKTVASTATRPADVISKTGVSGEIGQVEGFVAVEVDINNLLGNVGRNIINISSGAVANRIDLTFTSSATNEVRLFVNSGGVGKTTLTNVKTITEVGTYRFLIRYGDFGYQAYVNGELTASAVDDISDLSTSVIGIGSRPFSSQPFNDHISQALIGKTAISDAEAIAWTTL